MNDIMIDLETLGTKPTAVVVQIGAALFDIDTREIIATFDSGLISIDLQTKAGRTVCGHTVKWWLNQTKEAQSLFQRQETTPSRALADFEAFCAKHDFQCVWANSPSFDLTILRSMAETFGYAIPWKFWEERDVRTYLKSVPKALRTDLECIGTPHNALDDCAYQIIEVCEVNSHLANLKTKI